MLTDTVAETKEALETSNDADPAETELLLALAAAGTGTWQWRLGSRQLRTDKHLVRLFEPSAVSGNHSLRALLRAVYPKDRKRLIAQVRNLLKHPHPLVDDFRVQHPSGEIRWVSIKALPLTTPDGRVVGLIGIGQDVTDARRRASHTEQLLREVTHRSKNMLALVLAMARLTAKESRDVERHLKDFSLRVAGLSASQDLIVASDWENVDLGALAVAEVQAIARDQAERVTISGPSFLLTPAAAQTLGMILTELTLNALSNGALAHPLGSVKLGWELTPDGEIALSWRESGCQGFDPRKPVGYGLSAMERFSVQGLKVSAKFSAEGYGFTWTLSGPMENLGARAKPHRS